MSTEFSVCTKVCDAAKADGSGDSVTCTGFCRCEPSCGGSCLAMCCRLAWSLEPPGNLFQADPLDPTSAWLIPMHSTGCSVLRYDCDYRQTFMEWSGCDPKTHLCTCGLGYCGYNVSDDGHMVCAGGFGAPCMACPRGSFKPNISLAACEPCGPGYSTKYVGATQKEDCLPLCSNGTASATGFEVLL